VFEELSLGNSHGGQLAERAFGGKSREKFVVEEEVGL
jgi:hypothetical protein